MKRLGRNGRSCLFLRLTVLFLFCLAAEGLASITLQSGRVEPQRGGILRIKTYSQALNTDLDPAGNGYPLVMENLYEGLLRLDQNIGISPGLADYWVIDSGGKRVIFYLRDKAVFHNGQPVTAADVKFSLERLFRLKGNSYFYLFAQRIQGGEEFWQGQASEVTGLKIINDKTIEIDWKYSSVANLYFLASTFAKILPAELVQRDKKSFFDRPVGAGPFKFNYWLRNSKLNVIGISLSRNEQYFSRKPYLSGIEISPYFLLESFFRDEVQIVPYSSHRISKSSYQVLESNSLQVSYLIFSCHLPPFDQPEVRRLLGQVIEKSKLSGLVSSPAYIAEVLNDYIPPYLPGFLPSPPGEEMSFGRIAERLAAHGLGNSGKSLPVNLYFEVPFKKQVQILYDELKDELRPAGIDLQLKLIKSLDEIKNDRTPYLIYFDWSMPVPDPEYLLYPLFYSESYLNLTYFHYKHDQLDAWLDEQRNTGIFERRITLFNQIEELLKNEAPAIPLYFFKLQAAYQPYIKNLKPPPAGLFCLNLKDAWIDR
ncbi:MAG: ABC transporter substrate-binding protein [Acidobacteriota bacterium]|nr:ABC transporter substrate-binding protein [Acidobacteriota bacterium]